MLRNVRKGSEKPDNLLSPLYGVNILTVGTESVLFESLQNKYYWQYFIYYGL